MRAVVTRVKNARVEIEGKTVGKTDGGFLVLLGVAVEDTQAQADKLSDKVCGLRVFEDENGKTNLDLRAVGGELLLVSQFTLYADCRRGNRPGFTRAGKPDMASEMYEYIIETCRQQFPVVERGEFGADMKVELLNDGPFTILLDSEEL